MPSVLITGATGFVGAAVVRRFHAGHWKVVALTRDPATARARLPASVSAMSIADLAGNPSPPFDAVVHLAGASIAGGLWTRRRKDILWRSRVEGTRDLVTALGALEVPPRVLVSASGMGYYGHRGDDVVRPGDPPGDDFLGRMAAAWEAEASRAAAFGARVATIRMGMVLGRGGGALPKMALPFRLGAGAVLGPGTQYAPWIHVADAADMFFSAVATPGISGPLHGVSSDVLTQAGLSKALARVLRRPLLFRVPAFALRLTLGEMADLFLHGQRALPHPPVGLRFQTIEAALRDVYSGPAISARGG